MVPPAPSSASLTPTLTPPRKGGGKPAPTVLTAVPVRVVVEVDVPVRLVSEANAGGQRRAAIARKTAVKQAVRAALALVKPVPLPCRVTVTRYGAKELDTDNLPRSAKACRDVIAEWLGLPDDRDRRAKWVVKQRPAWEPFVRIRIEHTGGQTP
jgi:hypothetical protein